MDKPEIDIGDKVTHLPGPWNGVIYTKRHARVVATGESDAFVQYTDTESFSWVVYEMLVPGWR